MSTTSSFLVLATFHPHSSVVVSPAPCGLGSEPQTIPLEKLKERVESRNESCRGKAFACPGQEGKDFFWLSCQEVSWSPASRCGALGRTIQQCVVQTISRVGSGTQRAAHLVWSEETRAAGEKVVGFVHLKHLGVVHVATNRTGSQGPACSRHVPMVFRKRHARCFVYGCLSSCPNPNISIYWSREAFRVGIFSLWKSGGNVSPL